VLRLRAILAILVIASSSVTAAFMGLGAALPRANQWVFVLSCWVLALFVLLDIRAIRELTELLSKILRADVRAPTDVPAPRRPPGDGG